MYSVGKTALEGNRYLVIDSMLTIADNDAERVVLM